MAKAIKIYTDGACSGNQCEENVGGWGAILEYGEHRKELYGGMQNTTNNRMEMTALVEALAVLKKDGQILEIFSDSSYLVNCFKQGWHHKWLLNNWKRAGNKEVENRDLWEALLEQLGKHSSYEFFSVKGHVNLNSKTTNFQKLYEDFRRKNGSRFSFEDFKYVTAMNNRADALANMGIAENR